MKFKKILSSFLAFAVAFGAVSFAPFGNNGSFLNSAIVAEAKTGNSATKMPDDAITFSSTYSDELQIIPLVNKNGICYYNNKAIYFYSVAHTEKFMITTIRVQTKTMLCALMQTPKTASFILFGSIRP